MKIKITAPCTVRLTFEPGDSFEMAHLTPEVEQFLKATRIDGETVARIVSGRQEVERAVSVR